MRLLLMGAAIVLIAVSIQFSLRAEVSNQESTPLGDAVREFNAKAVKNSIGKEQPALTEDEVVAAIRGWIPENTPGVTDDVYDQFQEIAESRKLPEGFLLRFLTGWDGYRGYDFKVWWVDLSIKTGEKTGYNFRIRDQKISSRKMTPDELAEMKRRNRRNLNGSPK